VGLVEELAAVLALDGLGLDALGAERALFGSPAFVGTGDEDHDECHATTSEAGQNEPVDGVKAKEGEHGRVLKSVE
jgi:hypothetical protein